LKPVCLGRSRQEALKLLAALGQRKGPHILPIEEQEVEGDHHKAAATARNGGSDAIEGSLTRPGGSDDLAVDYGRLAAKLCGLGDDRRMSARIVIVMKAIFDGVDVEEFHGGRGSLHALDQF